MRALRGIVLLAALTAACDDRPPLEDRMKGVKVEPASSATAAATASAALPPEPPASASKVPMPPRPVPIGSSGPIQPSAPADQQMMAIQYTLAMVSPQPGDPMVDKAFIEDITKKLDGAIHGADKGDTPANPIRVMNGGRKLMAEMGKGCSDRTPVNLLVQRAGASLKRAFDSGVLVMACHDDKWECHQSTRDPNDVLCHAAPRMR